MIEVLGSRYVFFFSHSILYTKFFYRNLPKEIFEWTEEIGLEILGPFSEFILGPLQREKTDLIIEGSGLPSDGEDSAGITPVIATPITSSAPPPNSTLDTITGDSSSTCPLSSLSADGSVGESVPPSSTVMS